MKIPQLSRLNLNNNIKDLLERYFEMVLKENQNQNLTRITDPGEFFEKNITDCLELLDSGFLDENQVDLGSGAGIPGLICAILEPKHKWTLIDSENSKAEFLKRAINELDLRNAEAISGRAELILDLIKTNTVVSRAVGTVEKIYKSIRKCSTWNKLILLKGPGWPIEWEDFKKKKSLANHLNISRSHAYSKRVIIELVRVPRGT